MQPSKEEIKLAAENSLVSFIRLVAPQTVLGQVHEELCQWWTRQEKKQYQLTLLPRDHQKSRMIAYKAAWYLTNNPDHRILFISSTANLAEKQLKFIKDILTSKIYTVMLPLWMMWWYTKTHIRMKGETKSSRNTLYYLRLKEQKLKNGL